MNWTLLLTLIQVFFAVIIGMYFMSLLKNQRSSRTYVDRESRKEMEQLRKMRSVSLSEPLSEKTRPATLDDIVGQEDGIRALRAALCGPNPQHVIVYGPPGVGKTAAARVILEEAKKQSASPFNENALFTEIDATTARFDERGIADPLIGSVHDPIYQGAGAMGQAGIPQPKPGAVTKAHGGILFIDEIGELHPIQLNKLLKVLEDRKVFLESAYYSEENQQIPKHIHDIFQNGLPADFRLVGATTRTPDELPPAIRSRCLEIFFRSLVPSEVYKIAMNAVEKMKMEVEENAVEFLTRYATNGREAVNMIQIAAGIAITEQRNKIVRSDIEWVVNSSQKSPRPDKKVLGGTFVGLVNGLAIYGPNMGALLEIEVTAAKVPEPGTGTITITGVVDEEEMGGKGRTLRRKSMARGSLENVLTVLRLQGVNTLDYTLHVNFPGGIPIDGPSAGIAMATAIYSAITNQPIDNHVAMTGELSIHGTVKPIGGAVAKVEAARFAGVKKVLIPKDNWQDIFKNMEGVQVIAVEHLDEVLKHAIVLQPEEQVQPLETALRQATEILNPSPTSI
ncbi:ATP-dependent protease LonB [Aneurinibacillus aneurinilyticus]|uniref:endopeptidase La n=1 Tax=Aneurinibacillus aneurinilyticus ATCC 12856 TaxID=649747 RepID=U1X9A7_ANEAE|nr:ATP-dependent protease LonB [Aneurinibacillus aneurinilyticus]ERI11555.1 ATP-dependent protease LonB [Aneurinibacillus aneurinilyticus ATCC 12856]MED0706170.1 ATP-dependent protease LonB [Aneurinibacillus aneurinilyticus]MED0724560.1 ATP-dependent protease LonB [Aneurinibacillus aneurinilyticus]MED0734964.1 ATP-dependent protease LonB [Aneurinibacillus aneurinilyticus]MED0741306.1 ATP-dependent protease LonB [Aneurinibacillus aneurinilyticus]